MKKPRKRRDPIKHRDYIRAYHRRERLRLIKLFGGKCVYCEEDDPVVLDFDHIHNDGLNRPGSRIFEIQRTPERFQLLCKNCNWRKEFWRRRNAE